MFGAGYDLCVADESNKNTDSWTLLNETYQAGASIDAEKAKTLLCGCQKFQTTEVEAFALI